jgi:hypothetical protein
MVMGTQEARFCCMVLYLDRDGDNDPNLRCGRINDMQFLSSRLTEEGGRSLDGISLSNPSPYFVRPILIRASSCFSPHSCSPANFGLGNGLASDEVGVAGAPATTQRVALAGNTTGRSSVASPFARVDGEKISVGIARRVMIYIWADFCR